MAIKFPTNYSDTIAPDGFLFTTMWDYSKRSDEHWLYSHSLLFGRQFRYNNRRSIRYMIRDVRLKFSSAFSTDAIRGHWWRL